MVLRSGCCPGCCPDCCQGAPDHVCHWAVRLGGVRVLSRVLSGAPDHVCHWAVSGCCPSRVLSRCSGSCLPLGSVRLLSRVLWRGAVQGAPDRVCYWAVSGCCPGCCARDKGSKAEPEFNVLISIWGLCWCNLKVLFFWEVKFLRHSALPHLSTTISFQSLFPTHLISKEGASASASASPLRSFAGLAAETLCLGAPGAVDRLQGPAARGALRRPRQWSLGINVEGGDTRSFGRFWEEELWICFSTSFLKRKDVFKIF